MNSFVYKASPLGKTTTLVSPAGAAVVVVVQVFQHNLIGACFAAFITLGLIVFLRITYFSIDEDEEGRWIFSGTWWRKSVHPKNIVSIQQGGMSSPWFLTLCTKDAKIRLPVDLSGKRVQALIDAIKVRNPLVDVYVNALI
jgi:hypothetical protein